MVDRKVWQTKPAGELRDKDELRHHGYIDWTAGYSYDQIAVNIWSAGPRRNYTLLLSNKTLVEWRRP